ncbi:MAG: multidrug effflux MFS transporter [Inquilinus sp.]|nr:multidrug effflux MFS transporter [Inquilinus sp.]
MTRHCEARATRQSTGGHSGPASGTVLCRRPGTKEPVLTSPHPPAGPRLGEFVALTALMISLVALSIDAMLPALRAIGDDLGAGGGNRPQLVLSALFLGLAIAQMLFGPLSDSIGRKPAIYAGMAVFIAGCLLSTMATSFPMMLAGRFLQGFGAAGPRIATVALVRDRYDGRAMARIMSLVMGVFILVPAVAPALGQGILVFAHWRAIFGLLLALALTVLVWFALRQPETLAPARRARLSPRRIGVAIVEVVRNRVALGYTLTAGLIFGAFIGFLVSAPQIFQEQYGVGALFPAYFATLALAIGGASVVNARLVMRLGMRALSWAALLAKCGLALGFLAIAWGLDGEPPLWALMAYLLATFFCLGLLFGNFNALAMEPMGHIAGVAAAVIGSLTTFLSLALGTAIGQSYDGTILPLVAGFTALGAAATLVMHWVEKGRG